MNTKYKCKIFYKLKYENHKVRICTIPRAHMVENVPVVKYKLKWKIIMCWSLNSGPHACSALSLPLDLLSRRSSVETLHQSFFGLSIFQARVSWTVCPGWFWTIILLISASCVASIIGVSHQHLEKIIITLSKSKQLPLK
jgi:hypothetical protein